MADQTKELRAIKRLLAVLISNQGYGLEYNDLIALADKEDETVKTDQPVSGELAEQIEVVYQSYPGKCPTRKTSTGKNSKDKKRIKNLIEKKGFEKVLRITNEYVAESISKGSYLKNFSTFLNQFPDDEENGLFRQTQSIDIDQHYR